jgi:predicted outer membrane repeat protein
MSSRLLAAAAVLCAAGVAHAQDCNGNGTSDALELAMPGAVALPDDTAGLNAPAVSGFPTNAFTVEMWARKTSPANQHGLFSYGAGTNDNEITILDINSLDVAVDGVFQFSTFDAEAAGAVDEWNHYSISWRSSDGLTEVRVNGATVQSYTLNAGATITDGGCLFLGQEQDSVCGTLDPNQAFEGRMREVRLWNTFRTQPQVAADFELPLTGSEAGLVSYWPLNDGFGSTAADLAGSNDLQFVGATDWITLDANNDGVLDDCAPPINNITQGTDEPSIQLAINAASAGDIIELDPGTYVENIDFNGMAVTMRSASGNPADTILDGGGAGTVVTCVSGEGPDSVLEGLTITNGQTGFGGGMLNADSSPTITNCVFVGNVATSLGGAMRNLRSNPVITNCVFSGNTAGIGAAIQNDESSPSITNCTFSENVASLSGGAVRNIDSSNPTLSNSIFWGNTPDEIANDSSSPIITHCNIQGGLPSGAIDDGGNIDVDPLFVDADGPDNIPGTLDDNLRVTVLSPCIDAGRDAALPTVGEAGILPGIVSTVPLPVDLDGNARAFDSLAAPSPEQVFTLNVGLNIADGGLRYPGIFVTGGPTSIDRVELEIDVTHPNVDELTVDVVSTQNGNLTSHPWIGSCAGFADLTARFGDGFPGGPCSTPVSGNILPGDAFGIFEGLDATAGNDNWGVRVSDTVVNGVTGTFNSFSLIFKPSIVDMGAYENTDPPLYLEVPTDVATVQGAIDLIADNPSSVIEVLPGTYVENLDLLGKAVTLRSASGNPADTILDGGGAAGVVIINSGEGPDTVVEGFSITNGDQTRGGGIFISSSSSPTVRRCIFVGNTAGTDGGGLHCRSGSSPTVIDCLFIGNSAGSDGGGLYCDASDVTLVNCAFSGNSSSDRGGAIALINTDLVLTNSTIANNVSADGGGIWCNSGADPTFVNSVLWANTPDQLSLSSSPTIAHCNIQGGLPVGTIDNGGNIDTDPLFVDADGADNIAGTIDDDLRLLSGSPSTDAGDNTAPGLSGVTTDLEGAPRFIDNPFVADTGVGPAPVVDMGAYEYQGPPPCSGDINGDGSTNLADFTILATNFGATGLPFGSGQSRGLGDLNDDGSVNLADFTILASDFGCAPLP